MRLRCLNIAVLTLVTALFSTTATAQVGGAEVLPWPRCTPEEQGVDSETLLASLRRVIDQGHDTHGLIVIRNGHLILECYRHPYGPDTLHNLKSVSKSVSSALVGIALEKGVIKDLETPVCEYFPQHFPEDCDPRKRQITLRHLLTMTAGTGIDENSPMMGFLFRSPDWVKTAIAWDLADDPGTTFKYSTPLTHIMSGVLTEASGVDLLEFADEHLFGPLGFGEVQWTQGPKGYRFGGAELFMRPRDMARFGQLFLDGGSWNGEQLIDPEWVAESTRNQLPRSMGREYGYWWWMGRKDGYQAQGWGGQKIRVWPEQKMVVVETNADHRAADTLWSGFDRFALSDDPLPANPDAVTELEQLIEGLARPAPGVVPELPPIAKRLSDRTFKRGFGIVPPDLESLKRFSFHFDDSDTCSLTLELKDDELVLPIGLDGIDRVTSTGTLGDMPEGNEIALRGEWEDDSTFRVEAHWMGGVVHGSWRFAFAEDKVKVSITIRPVGRTLVFRAKMLAEER